FDVSYTTKNERALLVHGELTLDITEQKHLVENLATGSELILGVRAEHIALAKKSTPAANATASVRVTELLGSKSIVTLTLTDTGEPLKVIQPAGLTFDMGEKVWLQIEKESISIFDKKSEEAIV
ncbi:MAG: TOBE domain-containing protein, partial [Candidatus Bathyarchaeia archaeon]